jgi:hypothetical protein
LVQGKIIPAERLPPTLRMSGTKELFPKFQGTFVLEVIPVRVK